MRWELISFNSEDPDHDLLSFLDFVGFGFGMAVDSFTSLADADFPYTEVPYEEFADFLDGTTNLLTPVGLQYYTEDFGTFPDLPPLEEVSVSSPVSARRTYTLSKCFQLCG